MRAILRKRLGVCVERITILREQSKIRHYAQWEMQIKEFGFPFQAGSLGIQTMASEWTFTRKNRLFMMSLFDLLQLKNLLGGLGEVD